jgi:sialic acid synthase SpsE
VRKINVIAEAGINWESFDEAVDYAEIAKEIGADIVKYQYIREDMFSHKPFHMNKGEWKALKQYCDKIGIEFLCTPFSDDITIYLRSIGMKKLKISSGRACEYRGYESPRGFEQVLVSDGYDDNNHVNMYCISVYPCDPKLIDFDKMSDKRYIGFSDHTLRYDKEWVRQIPGNILYYEKHIKLSEKCIDVKCSLAPDAFKALIEHIREAEVLNRI